MTTYKVIFSENNVTLHGPFIVDNHLVQLTRRSIPPTVVQPGRYRIRAAGTAIQSFILQMRWMSSDITCFLHDDRRWPIFWSIEGDTIYDGTTMTYNLRLRASQQTSTGVVPSANCISGSVTGVPTSLDLILIDTSLFPEDEVIVLHTCIVEQVS